MVVSSGSVDRSPAPLTPDQRRLAGVQAEQAGFIISDFRGQRSSVEDAIRRLDTDFGGQFTNRFDSGLPAIEGRANAAAGAGLLGLGQLRSFGDITDQESSNLSASTQASFDAGQGRINRGLQDRLQVIGQEVAPSRGLRPTDTPITDLGVRAAGLAFDQTSDLAGQLAVSEQQQRLALPLQRGAQLIGAAGTQANLQTQAQEFQSQLRQSSFLGQLGLRDFANKSRLGLIGASSRPFTNLSTPVTGSQSQRKTDFGGEALFKAIGAALA